MIVEIAQIVSKHHQCGYSEVSIILLSIEGTFFTLQLMILLWTMPNQCQMLTKLTNNALAHKSTRGALISAPGTGKLTPD